jgi:metal-dependent amidase/aminoacylase/carboxypeptidase family protein
MKDIIKNAITNLTGELEGISKFLFENPELGNEEFNSSALLKDYLKLYIIPYCSHVL